jgi:hypothetical protein
MFEDKNLERVLRREERNGIDLGFGADVILMNAQWMAVLPRHRLMDEYRQTLGAIVEALGYIPDNEIVHIQLSRKEYIITHPLPEVVGEDIDSFIPDEEELCKYTGLSSGVYALFQTRDGTIYGCLSVGPSLRVMDAYVGEGVLVRRDENTGEAVYRRTDRPREDKNTAEQLEAWRYLEARQWCRWDDEPKGEIEGQEEIDDG